MNALGRPPFNQRRLIEILRVIGESDRPIGARAISDLLSERGFEIGERAVRYNLKILDELGYTRKHGYTGRALTFMGQRELSDALVNERIGFVNSRIEAYMLQTTLAPGVGGKVVVNTSLIKNADYDQVANILERVYSSGYCISNRVHVVDEGEDFLGHDVPLGWLGLATVCSITLDGLLLRSGIPVNTSFAGLMELDEGRPKSFQELIAYSGSSIDPIRAFMARRMTRVINSLQDGGGGGRVLANVREVPGSAWGMASGVLNAFQEMGFKGFIRMGNLGETVFGCPVTPGKMGIALYAGVNSTLALEEAGMEVRTIPISALIEYQRLREMR